MWSVPSQRDSFQEMRATNREMIQITVCRGLHHKQPVFLRKYKNL
ncbi:hypothetical protein SS05631_c19260 [Sinorhizobium sp. CCBAU 05631]|nr:hypothetical protein SS05631_c19260 [Sinorhizobium sp. CCBAU 05631]